MTELDEQILEAREALARRDWATARARFRAAREPAATDLAGLATACWWLGLVDEFVDATEEVHRRCLQAGAPAGAAMAALEIGFSEVVRGRQGVGAGWLARARRLLEELPEAAEHGYLLALDADWATQAGELDRAEELVERLLVLADRHGDPTLQAQGLFAAGVLALRRGGVDEAMRCLDEAMLPVRSGRVLPEWAGNLYCRMMQLCHELGDLPRAQRWTDITERWWRGYAPAVIFRGICRVHRVQLLQVQGDWARAEQEAKRATSELAEIDVVVAGEAEYRLGELHRLRGDLDAAEAAYRRAHVHGRDPLPGMALLHLCRGRGSVAASILDAALAATEPPLARAPLLAARVEVALAAEDLRAATRAAEELSAIGQQHRSPGWCAEARRCEGAVLVAGGRYAEAVPVLREARSLWQRMEAPYEVARIRLDLAQSLEALGDHETAARERDVAAELLEQLGARRDLARLRAGRRARGSPGSLSARELEVVAAVADGGTNREAAEQLHISERTVARHLANVYLKTGVSSRTGAVSWARERGLL